MRSRKHRFVIEVQWDRPMDEKRAARLLQPAINQINGLGRDLTRPGIPECRLIRATVKNFGKVTASQSTNTALLETQP